MKWWQISPPRPGHLLIPPAPVGGGRQPEGQKGGRKTKKENHSLRVEIKTI